MNGSALLVEWDILDRKEIEEAKSLYRQARREGRKVRTISGHPVEHFRPVMEGFLIEAEELGPRSFAFRIFDEHGDRRLIWNSLDPAQIKEAAGIFKDYLAKGWKAYAVDEQGQIKRRILEFDAEKCELVFDDRTTLQKLAAFPMHLSKTPIPVRPIREKLSAFVEKFKQVHLLPKTYPG